jgi:hypothetical protein
MEYFADAAWHDGLVLASTVARSGATSAFYRAFNAGQFLRLAEGVFIPASTWAGLDADERFLARVHAVAKASRSDAIFSHLSAAALWRLPFVGQWPTKPEVVVGSGAIGASRQAYTARHYPIPPAVDVIDGLSVTPLARTVIDIGRTSPLVTSVAMMDRALAPTDRLDHGVRAVRLSPQQLFEEFDAISTPRGRRRCGIAIELADGASGSAGESLSRVNMFVAGIPAPILQHSFYDSFGRIGIVDFWWPEFNLIGEFDGRGKYLRESLLNGKSSGQAVLDEKRREDRLRAVGPRVTRWGWDVALQPSRLAAHLRAAGLR